MRHSSSGTMLGRPFPSQIVHGVCLCCYVGHFEGRGQCLSFREVRRGPRLTTVCFPIVQVITEEAAIPFAMITGRELESTDYKGVALELLKVWRRAWFSFWALTCFSIPLNCFRESIPFFMTLQRSISSAFPHNGRVVPRRSEFMTRN